MLRPMRPFAAAVLFVSLASCGSASSPSAPALPSGDDPRAIAPRQRDLIIAAVRGDGAWDLFTYLPSGITNALVSGAPAPSPPSAMVVDGGAAYVLFAPRAGSVGSVARVDLATGQIAPLLQLQSQTVAFAVGGGDVLVATRDASPAPGTCGGAVLAVATSGGPPRTIVDGVCTAGALPVAADSDHVYFVASFADDATTGVWQAAHDGTQRTRLAVAQPSAVALTLDAASVYWLDAGPSTPDCQTRGGSISRVAKTGGAPFVLAASLQDADLLVADGGEIFFSADNPSCLGSSSSAHLERVRASGGTVEKAAEADSVAQIAPTSDRVYWLTRDGVPNPGKHGLGSVAR